MVQQALPKLPQREGKPDSLWGVWRELVRTNGPRKQSVLAEQLGVSESHLSEVMGGHKHLPEAWLYHVAQQYDPDGKIAACVAGWKGLTVRAARPLSTAALWRATLRVLDRHNGLGAELRKEIEAEAVAEPTTDEESGANP